MKKSRVLFGFILILVWVASAGLGPLPQLAKASSPVQVVPAAPDPFGKLSPTSGTTDVPTTSVILRWNPSSEGVTYQYCLRPNDKGCKSKKWISVGTNTSVVLQGLTAGRDYFWQVRAVDSTGQITYADSPTSWWKFSTASNPALPGAFEKLTPTDPSYDQEINGLVLTWNQSTGATSYQYCYDTRNNGLCDTTWTTASGLAATLNGLSYGTTYYWQVRAVNAAGNVQADYGDWSSFQTKPAPGGAFGKTDPVNYATEQPISLTLIWGLSEGTGITYDYCLSTSPCTPESTWTPAGTELSVDITNLQYETTYHWQVRAKNQTATVYADKDAEWTFSTVAPPPTDFDKTSPGDTATGQPVALDLKWSASTGAASYEYCLDTTTCTTSSTWLPAGASTSVSVNGLAYNTPYFWQVRAINTTGTTYANDGTGWQFRTQAAPPFVFGKLSPANGTPNVPKNLTLHWTQSTGATGYTYCIDTVEHPVGDNTCPNPVWVSGGAVTQSSPLSLENNTTYYWQVRAEGTGSTLADNGVWWSFTTIATDPSGFSKTLPPDAAIDQSVTPWLYWLPNNLGDTYYYSVCTTNPCLSPSWVYVGVNASSTQITSPLTPGTKYYWQVRAGATVEANSGAWWSFTTLKAPPTVSNQPFSMDENTTLNGLLTATSNYDTFFSLYGNQPAGVFTLQSDGHFTYTPGPNFSGVVTFQFFVSDGHNPPVGPRTATITVNEKNFAPVLSPIPDQEGERGKELTFYVQGSDPDTPYGQDYLTYSIDETLPSGASIDPTTGLFRWPVPIDQPVGKLTFTVRVTDSGNLSATQTVNITVNKPPVLSAISDKVGERGKDLAFTAQATDPDTPYGDLLTYDVVETLPAGASIDPTTGLFHWLVPSNQAAGTHTFTVRVTDSLGLMDTQTVNIKINVPPVLNPISDLEGVRGKELTFSAQASDPGDQLTYSLTGAYPPGASIESSTGVFHWLVPTSQPVGKFTFTVQVTDSGGLTATQTVNITVPNFKLMLPLINR